MLSQLEYLDEKKKKIEEEIEKHHEILKKHGVGMTESLKDKDDFPRADLDIPSILTARYAISRLMNDHAALMNEIEAKLAEYYKTKEEVQAPDVNISPSANEIPQPFLCVQQVMNHSPAATAGILEGDKLVRFGSLSSVNFVSPRDLSTIAEASRNSPLPVDVLRNGHILNLTLIPKEWPGSGLIGVKLGFL